MRDRRTAYALGLVAVVLAVLVRWVLDPLMGDALPLVTLFGAVAAAVWLAVIVSRFRSRCSATLLVIICSFHHEAHIRSRRLSKYRRDSSRTFSPAL